MSAQIMKLDMNTDKLVSDFLWQKCNFSLSLPLLKFRMMPLRSSISMGICLSISPTLSVEKNFGPNIALHNTL